MGKETVFLSKVTELVLFAAFLEQCNFICIMSEIFRDEQMCSLENNFLWVTVYEQSVQYANSL